MIFVLYLRLLCPRQKRDNQGSGILCWYAMGRLPPNDARGDLAGRVPVYANEAADAA